MFHKEEKEILMLHGLQLMYILHQNSSYARKTIKRVKVT